MNLNKLVVETRVQSRFYMVLNGAKRMYYSYGIKHNITYAPNRTNVQFMKIIDRENIQIEIWERGAGYTLASGSSSSAAAAVAHKLGLCDSSITVHMPGGQIFIQITDDFMVTMTGAVTKVAEGKISLEIFES